MDELIARLPKAELHLHLEGTISPETLWAMAEANAVALPVSSFSELRNLYEFRSFDAFIELWLLMCSCLRSPSDYERMVDGFLAECSRQNIRYAEVHFTPYNHERLGIGGQKALSIVTRRLMSSESAGGPVVRLITDISGESAKLSAPYTLTLLEQEAHPLIVALGLGDRRRACREAILPASSSKPAGPAIRRSRTRGRRAAPSTSARQCLTSGCAGSSMAFVPWKIPRSFASWPSGASAAISLSPAMSVSRWFHP